MHSRIMGVMSNEDYNKAKIEGNTPITLDLDGDNLPSFADYIDDGTDLSEDFDWFMEVLREPLADKSLLKVNKKDFTFSVKPGFKEQFFRGAWEKLVKNVLGAPDAFKQFCGEAKGDIVYQLKTCIDDQYGFYVADEYSDWMTLDMFVRRHMDYETTYKVFDSVDYHF